METWDAIRARRNVRRYTDEPVPEEHLPSDRPLRPITTPDRRPFEQVVHCGRW